MGYCPVGFCPSGLLSQWAFVRSPSLRPLFCLMFEPLKTGFTVHCYDLDATVILGVGWKDGTPDKKLRTLISSFIKPQTSWRPGRPLFTIEIMGMSPNIVQFVNSFVNIVCLKSQGEVYFVLAVNILTLSMLDYDNFACVFCSLLLFQNYCFQNIFRNIIKVPNY